jgi:tetratricopeptide (TPR) repeat protein
LDRELTSSLHPDSSIPPDALDGDTMEIPVEQLRGKPLSEAARPVPAPTPARAQSSTSAPNTTLWLALILIAAIVALLFIGAAAGLWSLPWKKSSIGRSSLNKAIAAKSLPEMHAVAPQPAPQAAAPVALPDPPPSATALVAAAASADPAQPSAAVLEAQEAAPLHAPSLSGGNLDDALDPPNPEVAPTLTAARAELRAGRPKEAEALLRPLLEKHADDQHVSEAMAQALLARGAAVEAVGFAQRVVKQRPKRASYRVLLGDALRRAGDEPSAKLAYREALALEPKQRDAQRRLKNRSEPRKVTATP